MEHRVVVTGMGAITPLGNDVKTFWENIKAGKCGIDFITKFDTTESKVKIAAEVKDFDAEKYIEKKETKRFDLFSQYSIAAAMDALSDSGLEPSYVKGNYRVGVIIGSGIGGLKVLEDNIIKMHEKGPSKISPLYIPMAITNMAAGNTSIKLGAKGLCSCVVTACASGTNSIGEAYRNIKHGYSDVMFAGGTESSVTESGIGGFAALKALNESNEPENASMPFDKDRSGFVLGEGAGCVVLESLEHALSRNARIYAEVVGYGATGDAFHMTSPDVNGEGAAMAMELAIAEANVLKNEIGYINAHGTSTELNDLPETIAIKKAFGDHAYKLAVSSTKSMTGHLLGAAGAIEAIITIKALDDGFIPPTIGLKEPDEGCDLDYVKGIGRSADIKYAISNSLGFGGHNAVLCFRKWEG